MTKEFILSEIQRTALDGKALGQKKFFSETGIKQHEWRGRYWARWGDAVSEAGLIQQEWTPAYSESDVFRKLLSLTRKLGSFPTLSEIQMASRSESSFPSKSAVSRLGSIDELKTKLLDFCSKNDEFADLHSIVSAVDVKRRPDKKMAITEVMGLRTGYVYLIQAQGAYKIGFSKAPYRRTAEIANQSADGAELLHLISTDDPEGIEDYWHRRFAEKRVNGSFKQSGEWFKLSKEDVAAFRRRKTM